jgi:hypothetical protein
MTSYVSTRLRRLVRERARRICEYCLIDESDTIVGCQVDHVISEKHGGHTRIDNLACACCNRAKGSDIGSIHAESGTFIRFFNPRADHWGDHFRLDDATIEPLTDIGTVTVDLLRLNSFERLLEREALLETGRYPPEHAGHLLCR